MDNFVIYWGTLGGIMWPFSHQNLNVHAAPASGSQLEADRLPRGKVLWE